MHIQNSHFKILVFVNLWVGNATLKLISQQIECVSSVIVDWSLFCRAVLFDAFIFKKTKLDGSDKIVKIDESKFEKRKYNRDHYVEDQWVFGGYERGTGRVFMMVVKNRFVYKYMPFNF